MRTGWRILIVLLLAFGLLASGQPASGEEASQSRTSGTVDRKTKVRQFPGHTRSLDESATKADATIGEKDAVLEALVRETMSLEAEGESEGQAAPGKATPSSRKKKAAARKTKARQLPEQKRSLEEVAADTDASADDLDEAMEALGRAMLLPLEADEKVGRQAKETDSTSASRPPAARKKATRKKAVREKEAKRDLADDRAAVEEEMTKEEEMLLRMLDHSDI